MRLFSPEGLGARSGKQAGSARPRVTQPLMGFSLLELLVVIAIIGILVAMLLPTLAKAKARSLSLQCSSNLRQNYTFLTMYATDNRGVPYPRGWGTDVPQEKRWPLYVFKPPVWNPPTMRCPADLDQKGCSYVLNGHLEDLDIRLGQSPKATRTFSEIIYMSEKKSGQDDLYLTRGEFERVAELHRHGLLDGSNYLYLDGHVDHNMPQTLPDGIDPWDPGGSP